MNKIKRFTALFIIQILLLTVILSRSAGAQIVTGEQKFSALPDTVTLFSPFKPLPLRPLPADSAAMLRKMPSTILQLSYRPDRSMKRFYNPQNVLPVNPLFLDTRSGSYYTPDIVQDRMDFIMNRPRADSFVPLPVAAMLAANLALKYVDIEKKLELSAQDYFLEEASLAILETLWNEAPRTAAELYEIETLRKIKTQLTLVEHLELLSENNLIKSREVEAGETLWFPAQEKKTVIDLLETALLDGSLPDTKRTRIALLLSRLKN